MTSPALLLWFAPIGLAIGLGLASLYRALCVSGPPRRYATAAAISFGAFVVAVLFSPLPWLFAAAMGLLGLGSWIAAALLSPAALLWAEAVILPISLVATWILP